MIYKIPLFDLNFDNRESEAVQNVLASKWISSGSKTVEFENKFSSLLNVNHSVALSNCTVALHLALKIIGIKKGDEVICPSLTFVATCNAIKYQDAVPVFVDVKSLDDLTIDPNEIEKKITNKTKAIIVMHYGGFACNMEKILDLATKYNIKIIEDACHAPLSEYKGRKLGTIGDIGCFSFFSNKNISTGEGGMLVTNNSAYFETARLLRSHGMTSMSYERANGHSTSYDVIDLGYNYRIDDIRSSIGIVQLDKVLIDIQRRAEIRNLYVEKLKNISGIVIPFSNNNEFVSNYIFPIILLDSTASKRDRVRDSIAKYGVQTSVHYPAAHLFSIYKELKTKLPLTEYITDNEITLPMYANLTEEDISYIVNSLRKSLVE